MFSFSGSYEESLFVTQKGEVFSPALVLGLIAFRHC